MVRSLWAVVGLLILCSGCSAQRPTASYKSMSIGDVSTHGFTMNVKIDVHNPNSVAIPLTNIDYSLSLAGSKLINAAKVSPGNSIPANGASTVTLPIPLTFENLLSVEEAIRSGNGDLKYGVEAALNFNTGIPVIGTQRVPFGYDGTLNVTELLKNNWSTILKSPAARELAQKVTGGLFKF